MYHFGNRVRTNSFGLRSIRWVLRRNRAMIPTQSYAPRLPGWAGYAAYRQSQQQNIRRTSGLNNSSSSGSPGSPEDFNPPYSGGGTFDPYPPGAMPDPTRLGPAFNPWNYINVTGPQSVDTSVGNRPPAVFNSPTNSGGGSSNIGGGGGTGGGGGLKVFDPSNPAAGGMDSSGQWHDSSGQNFDATSWLASHLTGNTNYGAVGNAPPARVQDAGATMFTNQHYVDTDGIIRLKTPANLTKYPSASLSRYSTS